MQLMRCGLHCTVAKEPTLNKQVALTCAACPCTFPLPTAVQSLQGHSTPVESVTFDHNEEVVAAGAASGSIKLFDLDQAKGTFLLGRRKIHAQHRWFEAALDSHSLTWIGLAVAASTLLIMTCYMSWLADMLQTLTITRQRPFQPPYLIFIFSACPAVTRAMSGHRSNVLSLELSQYGLLSGSMDTNVKVRKQQQQQQQSM